MELKIYQKKVMGDLERFLTLLTEKQNIKLAYSILWEEKGIECELPEKSDAQCRHDRMKNRRKP